jgi:hypothetical protein
MTRRRLAAVASVPCGLVLLKHLLAHTLTGAALGALGRVGEASPLLEARFEDAAAIDRWDRVEVARTGDGPESSATLDQGAARLSGDARTGRWMALERRLPLGRAVSIHVSARVRTERCAGNARLWVRFTGGPERDLAAVDGSRPWTQVEGRLDVPPGARDATVGAALAAPGTFWIDDVVVDAILE